MFANPEKIKTGVIIETAKYHVDILNGAAPDQEPVEEEVMETTLLNGTQQSAELTDEEREAARTKLNLPEDLRIERVVPNPLYDIYYIPGYDKYKIEGQCPDFDKSKKETKPKN